MQPVKNIKVTPWSDDGLGYGNKRQRILILEYYLNVDLIEQVMTERGSSKGGNQG